MVGENDNEEQKEMKNAEEGLGALLQVGYYNGHEDLHKKLYNYIDAHKQHEQEYPVIPYPNHIFADNGTCDEYPRILWSCMVVEYGDFGTSPRFGWIDIENAGEILAFIHHYLPKEDQ